MNKHKRKKSATYRQVWAALQELAEESKETDRRMKETDRRMQETDRQISKLGHRFGDIIEHLVAPNLLDKFAALGYSFTRISRNHEIKDSQRRRLAEIDMFLENGQYALAVEIKSLFTVKDVKDHLKRLYTLRRYADEHQDNRRYIGAVAEALYDEGAREEAVRSGFFVIRQAGDTVDILIPHESWKPRVWVSREEEALNEGL